jgi:hypothetical protein
VQPEGLCQRKIPMTPSRIEPATFRIVALYLNQLRHCVPQCFISVVHKFYKRPEAPLKIPGVRRVRTEETQTIGATVGRATRRPRFCACLFSIDIVRDSLSANFFYFV